VALDGDQVAVVPDVLANEARTVRLVLPSSPQGLKGDDVEFVFVGVGDHRMYWSYMAEP
jgi:hypothetical protein